MISEILFNAPKLKFPFNLLTLFTLFKFSLHQEHFQSFMTQFELITYS